MEFFMKINKIYLLFEYDSADTVVNSFYSKFDVKLKAYCTWS